MILADFCHRKKIIYKKIYILYLKGAEGLFLMIVKYFQLYCFILFT